jgi:deoxyribodipyrimidine photo-lyase
MRPLVWFRADLRVEDNPALYHACAEASRGVVGVFVVCPEQWKEHDWADSKIAFILRTLDELSNALEKRNVPLLVGSTATFEKAPRTLLRLAQAHECDSLYFNHEYEVNESRRDEAVRQAFERQGLKVQAFHDQTVVPPAMLRTTTDRFYTVFTPFRRAWTAHLKKRGVPEALGKPRRQPELAAEPAKLPTTVPGFDPSGERADLWPAGERAARRRLRQFIERRLRAYARQRDLPAVEGTSRLSPYLTVGAISARQCLQAAIEANRNRLNGRRTGPAVWISELVWREFYRHSLVGFPRVSMSLPYELQTDRLPWRCDEHDFDAWCAGQTGVPIVDAAMRQLAETGWMHNRLRMITAMYLTKDLFIDWRWGERHFMRQLIDGDLANNNGGWQWSASTGADAAPYFRVFNPVRQSRKFDPKGDFIRRYVPELRDLDDDAIHDPSASTAERSGLDYPEPLVDHAEAAKEAVAAFRKLKKS